MNELYTIDVVASGPRMVVHGAWTQEHHRAFADSACRSLSLNAAQGWSGHSLDFLTELSALRELHLLDRELTDVSCISGLRQLTSLKMEVNAAALVDLSGLSKLEEFSGFWMNVGPSLSGALGLRRLRLVEAPEEIVETLRSLKRLRHLALYAPAIRTLDGIWLLKDLSTLTIAHARRLVSIEAIGELSLLEELSMTVCNKIGSIDALARLSNLQALILDSCGTLPSLSPLADLAALRVLRFGDSTRIVDGNLEFIRSLRHLESLGYVHRPHYAPSWKDFPPHLFETRYSLRWT